jgi:DNA mismatch repair protein MutS
MSFTCDKQTLDDLNILGKYKPDSIYSLFNGVHTGGGEKLLDALFRNPLTDPDEINKRSALFRYCQDKMPVFPLDGELLSIMENYLSSGGGVNFLTAVTGTARKKLLDSIVRDEAYGMTSAGLLATIKVLNVFGDFVDKLGDTENPYSPEVRKAKEIFSDGRLAWLSKERDAASDPRSGNVASGRRTGRLSWFKLARYDHLLRNVLRQQMETLMGIIYRLDVSIAVGRVAVSKGFSYAQALPKETNAFRVSGLRHPRLEKGVANPLSFRGDSNMLFLTGANMAGKSTFMKAFGVSVYLAHMGFPVAAEEMSFSVKDGIYSSINVPDNLSLGYSHFYAEVLRVKKVAEEVSRSKDMVVIFDELFKGTNVKDAYDATLAVTAAFSDYRNCFFIISTHIIEVGQTLREGYDNLQFAYLPTVMDGVTPRYTYQLREGITTDRHGMMIIENEKILELI